MPKITIKKETLYRIGLVFLGILISFVVLEIVLRFGGVTLLAWQRYDNRLSPDNVYRVLTLGESTTANLRNGHSSWPEELEIILNNRSKGMKFKVFNEAVPGTRTYKIAARLNEQLEKYKPHMVITMMGANDREDVLVRHDRLTGQIKLFFKDFRVYKLFDRIIEGLSYKYMADYYLDEQGANKTKEEEYKREEERLKNHIDNYPKDFDALLDLAIFYQDNERYEELFNVSKRLMALKPKSPISFFSLGYSYAKLKQYEDAEQMLKRVIELQPYFDKTYLNLGDVYYEWNKTEQAIGMYLFYVNISTQIDERILIQLAELYTRLNNSRKAYQYVRQLITLNPSRETEMLWFGKLYQELNKSDEAVPLIKRALERYPNNFAAYTELTWHYLSNNMHSEAEEMFRKSMEKNPDHLLKLYTNMGVHYEEIGQRKKAEEMFKKSSELRRQFYSPTTQESYLDLYRMASERGITLVVMQYPTLDAGDLKAMFRGNEKIIFVSNKENFERVLANATYDDYFIDRIWQGTFGHATLKGNIVIAENAADTVLGIAGS